MQTNEPGRLASPLTEGLGPCPFCGSHDVLLTQDAARWPVVQCQDCGANGPSVKLSPDEAVAQWNSRPGVVAERERCAKLVETQDTNGDPVGGWFELLAAKIRA